MSTTVDDLKRAAARAALEFIVDGAVLGVGTGSTVNFFIEELARFRGRVAGAVASSEATATRLAAAGIRVVDLNDVEALPVYVDGADEITRALQMVKGGGGALTREKIVAAAAAKFVCIVDGAKLVDSLGGCPVPVEVIPMARSLVARELGKLGGEARPRRGFVSDNGNAILDVHGLNLSDPVALEARIDQLAGVVANGIFARRGADVALVAGPAGVVRLTR